MVGIPDGSRVLLDTVALVYFLERHPRYGATAQAIFRRIAAGQLRALIASFVFAELLVPLQRRQDRDAAAGLVDLLSNFHDFGGKRLDRDHGRGVKIARPLSPAHPGRDPCRNRASTQRRWQLEQ